MAEMLILDAHPRAKRGSHHADKLRKQGQVPAILYGHKEATVSLALNRDDLAKAIRKGARVIDLKTDELRNAAFPGSHGGISDSEKGIKHHQIIAQAMQANAAFHKVDREGGGMRPIFVTSHDGFVRNEPSISPAAAIASTGMAPACDVALVGVGDTQGKPIDRSVTQGGEMKNVFVTVVKIPRGTNRLEMSA